jgi:hypothetical protein
MRPSFKNTGVIFMKTPSCQHSLGIMTTRTAGEPPFGSRHFYRRLCLAGSRAGMDVFVFTPQGIDWLNGTTECFRYEQRLSHWVRHSCKLPEAVYDRCFFTDRAQYQTHRTAVRRLQEEHHALFLGCCLKGKWDVQRILERDGRFTGFLPQTEIMRGVDSAAVWLQEHGQVLLKPQAGSQGRGVLLVQREGAAQTTRSATAAQAVPLRGREAAGGSGTAQEPGSAMAAQAVPLRGREAAMFTVRGRDARNRRIARGFADEATLLQWLRRFTAQRRYLQQQYLLLQSCTGDAYDVRSLVQKDGTGRWQVTGTAVRRGQSGSLTSNLHGGGIVEPVGNFLSTQFNPIQANVIIDELRRLSELIPEALEASHGRLVELGIDFGIDTSGHIWILEVNSKPGRSIFDCTQDEKAHIRAVTNPIRYARYLLLKSLSPKNSVRIAGLS